MIAVIQRCSRAHVAMEDQIIGEINSGLVILLGVHQNDSEEDAEFLADKVADLRIFNDSANKMNLSLLQVGGSALVISQFTLCGDWRKGRRPSFINAAPPEEGARLYEYFIAKLQERGVPTARGKFGAMMKVHLINDGPVTFVLDSQQR